MRLINILVLTLALDGIVPAGDAFLRPLQKRDSILVADQLEYGVVLEGVEKNTDFAFPDFSLLSGDTLTVIRNWKLDTLKRSRRKALMNIKASVILAPFEEGQYKLPPLLMLRQVRDSIDTLRFEGVSFKVSEYPVDTLRIKENKLMPLMEYPVTFLEILPWMIGGLLLAGGIVFLVIMIRRRSDKGHAAEKKDPAHIVALRSLDRYRDRKYWAPEKQKAFYSGVTDTLKTYIDERFAIDAPEMTTAELFAALKDNRDLTPDLYAEMKDLFESADFVKFAKFTATDEENARVLPTAVRFVTDTYKAEIEEETEEKKGGKD